MFFRRALVLVLPCFLGAAAADRAWGGQIVVEPHVTTSGGYDGNYFYEQEVTAQTDVTPMRAAGGVDVSWRPSLRWRLSLGGDGAVERLYGNPTLGTLQSAGGRAGVDFLPSYWSLVSAGGYVQRDVSTDPELRFLTARYAGADAFAVYRFETLSAGFTGAFDNAVFAELGRTDTALQGGPFVAAPLAGWWRLDVRYAQTRSTWPEIAGGGPLLRLGYRRGLWQGGEVRVEAGLRRKDYEEANRVDNRWSLGAGMSHAFGNNVDVGARIDQTLNRSTLREEDYTVTTFSCAVSVHPSWSFSY